MSIFNDHEHECGECGGNCDPECGQHPRGCQFSGVIYGEWQITKGCQLKHYNVARALAHRNLETLGCGIVIQRSPFAK